jgi:hypothetical protein
MMAATSLSLVEVCLLAKPPYVAWSHPWTHKLVLRHFSNGFGQLAFVHGTLLRPNSMALFSSDSYARKFRTIRGLPSESKVVTRMFHPTDI